MSNFDYTIGYLPVSKEQMQTHKLNLLIKKVALAIVTVCFCIFFYTFFISNPIPDIQARQVQTMAVLPNEQTIAAPSKETEPLLQHDAIIENNLLKIKKGGFEIAAVSNENLSISNELASEVAPEINAIKKSSLIALSANSSDSAIKSTESLTELSKHEKNITQKKAIATVNGKSKYVDIMLTGEKPPINSTDTSEPTLMARDKIGTINTDNINNDDQSSTNTLFKESELESLFNLTF